MEKEIKIYLDKDNNFQLLLIFIFVWVLCTWELFFSNVNLAENSVYFSGSIGNLISQIISWGLFVILPFLIFHLYRWQKSTDFIILVNEQGFFNNCSFLKRNTFIKWSDISKISYERTTSSHKKTDKCLKIFKIDGKIVYLNVGKQQFYDFKFEFLEKFIREISENDIIIEF